MNPHLLCIGGSDHHLRLPFLKALRDRGFQVSAAGTGAAAPFETAGVDYYPLLSAARQPLSDWKALRTVSKLVADLRPGLVPCFDTKPDLMVPLAAWANPDVRVVSTINGIGLLYSLRSPVALALRPVYETLQRLAAQKTAVTVFQNRDDEAFFLKKRLLGRSAHLIIPGSGVAVDQFDKAVAAGPPAHRAATIAGLEGCEVVKTVTRMTRQKGIPTLLKAAALVHRQRPGVRFLLIRPREDEGPFAVTQAEIDRHAPYVQALGRHSDVHRCLASPTCLRFRPNTRRAFRVCSSKRPLPAGRCDDAEAGLHRCHS